MYRPPPFGPAKETFFLPDAVAAPTPDLGETVKPGGDPVQTEAYESPELYNLWLTVREFLLRTRRVEAVSLLAT
jgi:hypothetical protein